MSLSTAPILIVDDDPDIREALKDRLIALGYAVAQAANGRQAVQMIADEEPAAVFLDLQMPQLDGMETLRRIRVMSPDLAVVIITAHGTIERAVEAMRQGALDFVTKPFSMDYLEGVVRRILERRTLKRENILLREQAAAARPEIVGRSTELLRAIEIARKVAATSSTVLLLGESGTGKEVFARWIHQWSPRHDGPFVVVNCVALRDELLESELFGHERGAFTGAHEMRQGRLEIADGGTVFLDEIGDFRPELQAKLLRVLQEREFERVGGNKRIQVNIRVIAATHRNLSKEVEEGRFREDLYFRLNVVAVSLPPLRERREDIPLLAEHFLHRFCQGLNKPLKSFAPQAIEHLLSYDWPGNVRELANLIERAVILSDDAVITPDELPVRRTPDFEPARGAGYREAVRSYQRRVVRDALIATDGNQARAAERLGLGRTYLSRLIRKLGLSGSANGS